jgi:hypothetical protein
MSRSKKSNFYEEQNVLVLSCRMRIRERERERERFHGGVVSPVSASSEVEGSQWGLLTFIHGRQSSSAQTQSLFIYFLFQKVIIHIITYPAVPLDTTYKENIKLQIKKLSKWRSL